MSARHVLLSLAALTLLCPTCGYAQRPAMAKGVVRTGASTVSARSRTTSFGVAGTAGTLARSSSLTGNPGTRVFPTPRNYWVGGYTTYPSAVLPTYGSLAPYAYAYNSSRYAPRPNLYNYNVYTYSPSASTTTPGVSIGYSPSLNNNFTPRVSNNVSPSVNAVAQTPWVNIYTSEQTPLRRRSVHLGPTSLNIIWPWDQPQSAAAKPADLARAEVQDPQTVKAEPTPRTSPLPREAAPDSYDGIEKADLVKRLKSQGVEIDPQRFSVAQLQALEATLQTSVSKSPEPAASK